MKKNIPQYRAVLFDFDGTLVDSAADFYFVLQEMARRNLAKPSNFTIADIAGCVSEGVQAMLEVAFPQATPQQYPNLRQTFLDIYATNIGHHSKPFPAIEEMLQCIEDKNIPWGVVSNKHRNFGHQHLQRYGWDTRAAIRLWRNSLAQCKPHPAPLLHACAELKINPTECLYIGDALNDVEAAQAAGIPMLVARFCPHQCLQQAQQWPALAIVNDPKEVLHWLNS